MHQPVITPYPITDFIEWYRSGQLVMAPKFQRRDVWIPKAKSYLIDTILRGMPIPPVFLRLRVDPQEERTIREVVDGQQRLNAILGYRRGEFAVMKVHNAEYGGMQYGNLPDDAKAKFLAYQIMVNVMGDVGDTEVLSIFSSGS